MMINLSVIEIRRSKRESIIYKSINTAILIDDGPDENSFEDKHKRLDFLPTSNSDRIAKVDSFHKSSSFFKIVLIQNLHLPTSDKCGEVFLILGLGRNSVSSCRVCGDRSYGRHYGQWTCDGLASSLTLWDNRDMFIICCRSESPKFLMNIDNRTCAQATGHNECVIDKTRRNWCQSCRLAKCFKLNMNINAVQCERGPRCTAPTMTTSKSRKGAHDKKTNRLTLKMNRCCSMDEFFLATVYAVNQSVLLTFSSIEDRRELVKQYYPKFFALTIAMVDEKTRKNQFDYIMK
ncbi:zinc finger, C4 type [Dictyocaulus viviparus]|uniref:Zinc finger, C4 type n=1 Tax=Dictyocaulus viviparus TaxID=29172 RepID=A0A0D8YD76_DICVI|nr:zinc finger, C4 type [Dictyocaulus viviparus]